MIPDSSEQPSKPTLNPTLKYSWHTWVLGSLFVIVLGSACYIGYQYSTLQQAPASTMMLSEIQPNTPSSFFDRLHPSNTSAISDNTTMGTTQAVLPGLLAGMTNQAAAIQILLNSQQFSVAISLLSTLEGEASLLPMMQQQEVMAAISADRERIQMVQTSRQQLLGQVQQLQQHINQQVLAYFGPIEETPAPETPAPETAAADTTFVEKIKHQLGQAVQVHHSDALTNAALPAFYSSVMLQLALYQAQFSLTQGNGMEYQLALSSVLPWLTPGNLPWLSDAETVTQTITRLSQQPYDYSGANVNETQQALINAARELNV